MPPRGRRTPELLGPDGTAGPEISIEESEVEHDEPGAENVGERMMYDGELLQTSMTLAVVLPGDAKESYFGARAVLRAQPDEDADHLMARGITVVRETVLGQIDDSIDAVAEYMQQLAASGRVPHA